MPASPFIVAEMSANHLGSRSRAHDIVDAAADAGADAIKLQTWKPGTMCISDYALDHGPWKGMKLRDLYEIAHTPWEWHAGLFAHARRLGLVPFSAAFDCESVDFLETLNVDRHKVASFELTDLPLIRHMASKGKPMILSTGMATEIETWTAYGYATAGTKDVTFLKCTSAYPSDASDANLSLFAALPARVGIQWGLSDHSLGVGVAVAAAALGATYIEKHLTLNRADGGPDSGFSMEPHEFKQMATECRRAAAAIGVPSYGPGPNESTALRRSWWAARDIQKGEWLIPGGNVVTARPALGLSPSVDLTGRTAALDVSRGTPITQEVLA